MKLLREKNVKKLSHQLTVGVRTQLCEKCEELKSRLCEADGKRAFFHRWVEEDKALLQFNVFAKTDYMQQTNRSFKEEGYSPEGTHIEKVRQTFALVEYEDGTVRKVEPEKVKFLDRQGQEDQVQWSKKSPCPITPEQFNAIYADDEGEDENEGEAHKEYC